MQQTLRSMALVPFLFVNAFLLAMAGVAIFAGVRARRRAALIKSMPTTNIGMAEEGYREFEGTIQAISGESVIAPLTQTPCAWYHAKLEEWERSSGNREARWHTIKESTSEAAIMLRDATGLCLVLPFLAEVTPTDKSQWTGATAVPTDRNPPKAGPRESTTPVLSVSGGPNSKFRYSEERIYVGDSLLVLGEFSRRQFEPSDDEEDEDENFEEDDLVDDEIDQDDSASAGAANEADEGSDDDSFDWGDSGRSSEVTRRAEETTRACIRKGADGKPFIMTTRKQETHVYMEEVGSQAALYIAVLPLAAVALLFYTRFG